MNGARTHALHDTPSDGEVGDALPVASDAKLRVTVVATTSEGTVAALRAAAELTKHLSSHIALVAPEVVPMRLPLEKPAVSIEFLKRRYLALVSDAGITDELIAIQIWLCRDPEQSLQHVLSPHSVIVIGGSASWWNRRERKLANWLRTQGHHVVFVDSATNHVAALESDNSDALPCFVRVPEEQARRVCK
ncbi:MAG: hypothetical protein ABSA32_15825 [Candidatus Acidiferrales bacterium]|jgi:hypothetical protein